MHSSPLGELPEDPERQRMLSRPQVSTPDGTLGREAPADGATRRFTKAHSYGLSAPGRRAGVILDWLDNKEAKAKQPRGLEAVNGPQRKPGGTS
jgi:hypothetical protein